MFQLQYILFIFSKIWISLHMSGSKNKTFAHIYGLDAIQVHWDRYASACNTLLRRCWQSAWAAPALPVICFSGCFNRPWCCWLALKLRPLLTVILRPPPWQLVVTRTLWWLSVDWLVFLTAPMTTRVYSFLAKFFKYTWISQICEISLKPGTLWNWPKPFGFTQNSSNLLKNL